MDVGTISSKCNGRYILYISIHNFSLIIKSWDCLFLLLKYNMSYIYQCNILRPHYNMLVYHYHYHYHCKYLPRMKHSLPWCFIKCIHQDECRILKQWPLKRFCHLTASATAYAWSRSEETWSRHWGKTSNYLNEGAGGHARPKYFCKFFSGSLLKLEQILCWPICSLFISCCHYRKSAL